MKKPLKKIKCHLPFLEARNYRNQLSRIEEAESLLLLSSYTIADICSWLHFPDQSYFTKVFKKHTGLTPKKYRENKAP